MEERQKKNDGNVLDKDKDDNGEGQIDIQINKNVKETESVDNGNLIDEEDSLLIKEEESDFDANSDTGMDSYKLIIKKEPENDKEIPVSNFQAGDDDDETNYEDQSDPLATDEEDDDDSDTEFEDGMEINHEKMEKTKRKRQQRKKLKVNTPRFSVITHFPEDVGFRECKICNIKFDGKRRYFEHNYVKHDGPKYFGCEQCKELFGTFDKLKFHYNRAHDPKMTCPKCKKIMGEGQLKIHLKSSHPSQKLKCSFPGCDTMFTRAFNLKLHENYYHKNLKAQKFKCSFPGCEKIYARIDGLKRHEDCHKSTQTYSCDICDNIFKTENYLKDHKLRVHESQVILKCPFSGCERTYRRTISLKRHLDTHKSTEKYPCDKCEKDFPTKFTLKKHLYNAHKIKYTKFNPKAKSQYQNIEDDSKTYSYKLIIKKEAEKEKEICNFQDDDDETNYDQSDDDYIKEEEDDSDTEFEDGLEINHEKEKNTRCKIPPSFQQRVKLKVNTPKLSVTTHFPEDVNFRECKICNIKFDSKRRYFSHNFVKHAGSKYFGCGKCEELFGTFRRTACHQESVHDPKVTCSKCKKIMGEGQLKIHLKNSHPSQKLKCSFPGCDTMFTRAFNLKLHENLYHKNLKAQKFKCSFPGCEKIYARSDGLKRHEDCHKSTQTYSCNKCDKEFSTENILKDHKLRVHESQEPTQEQLI